jgi:hypothetical protein
VNGTSAFKADALGFTNHPGRAADANNKPNFPAIGLTVASLVCFSGRTPPLRQQQSLSHRYDISCDQAFKTPRKRLVQVSDF